MTPLFHTLGKRPGKSRNMGAGSELVVNSAPTFQGTRIYQTNFDNYTEANLARQLPGASFVDTAEVITGPSGPTRDPNVQLVTGRGGTGLAVQITYNVPPAGQQQSHGIFGIISIPGGVTDANGTRTPPGATVVSHYWMKFDSDSPVDQSMRFKIKFHMMWHLDPNNERIQWNSETGQGGCAQNVTQITRWEVYDQGGFTGCNAIQPIGPTMWTFFNDGQFHEFHHLFKPNTATGSRDGTAMMWVDQKLIIWLSQQTVGVVPPGPLISTNQQPWCNQLDVDALSTYGVGTFEIGSVETDYNVAGNTYITVDDFDSWYF